MSDIVAGVTCSVKSTSVFTASLKPHLLHEPAISRNCKNCLIILLQAGSILIFQFDTFEYIRIYEMFISPQVIAGGIDPLFFF